MNSPCHNCPDRHVMCHATCEKYSKYKRTREATSDNRRKVVLLDRYHFDITARAEKIRRMHA